MNIHETSILEVKVQVDVVCVMQLHRPGHEKKSCLLGETSPCIILTCLSPDMNE